MTEETIWTRRKTGSEFRIMALEFDLGVCPPLERMILSWAPAAAVVLIDILRCASRVAGNIEINLPYSGLRPLLEMMCDEMVWLAQDVALSLHTLRGAENNKASLEFAHIDRQEVPSEEILSMIYTALDLWISFHLVPFCERNGIEVLADELRCMHRDRKMFVHTEVETDLPVPDVSAPTFYRLAPQYLGRLLEGTELFDGMGPVRRIVQNRLKSNQISLVTFPREFEHRRGLAAFSMRVDISVESLPFRPNPIMKVTARKVLWLDRPRSVPNGMKEIGGLVFPAGDRSIAIRFAIPAIKGTRGWGEWQIDRPLFGQMTARCGLPHIETLENLVTLPVESGAGWAGVYYTTRFSYSHPVGAGVPERDEADLLERVHDVLEGVAGPPVTGTPLTAPPSPRRPSRENPVMRLEEYLHANIDGEEDDPPSLDQLLKELFPNISSRDLDTIDTCNIRGEKIDTFRSMSADIVAHLHDGERPHLWLIAKTARERAWMQWAATALFGNALMLFVAELPTETHGPLFALSSKGERARERFMRRVEKWMPTARGMASTGKTVYAIVQAAMEYPGPEGKGLREDDNVNRIAGIHALAKYGNANVHYLLPPEGEDKRDVILSYLQRFQAAVFDLVFAHNAYTVGVKEIIEAAFPEEGRPREVIGISLVRQNVGYMKPGRNSVIGFLARTDVETGRSMLSLAWRERSGHVSMTEWMPFARGLRHAASQTHITIGSKRMEVEEGFRRMIERAVGDSCKAGNRPLVMVDVSSAKGCWSWLNDANLDPSNIRLDDLHQHMEEDWVGARIVRIRTNRSDMPVLQVKTLTSHEATAHNANGLPTSDVRRYDAWTTTKGIIETASTPSGGHNYLAVFGYPNTTQVPRNLSGYRSVEVMKKLAPGSMAPRITEKRQYRFAVSSDAERHLPTPNTIEITVAYKQPEDNPSWIAWACNELRVDHAHTDSRTTLPAPLFYENKLRTDYMILLKIEEAEAIDEETGTDEENQD